MRTFRSCLFRRWDSRLRNFVDDSSFVKAFEKTLQITIAVMAHLLRVVIQWTGRVKHCTLYDDLGRQHLQRMGTIFTSFLVSVPIVPLALSAAVVNLSWRQAHNRRLRRAAETYSLAPAATLQLTPGPVRRGTALRLATLEERSTIKGYFSFVFNVSR